MASVSAFIIARSAFEVVEGNGQQDGWSRADHLRKGFVKQSSVFYLREPKASALKGGNLKMSIGSKERLILLHLSSDVLFSYEVDAVLSLPYLQRALVLVYFREVYLV
jgi:hypothetical protein